MDMLTALAAPFGAGLAALLALAALAVVLRQGVVLQRLRLLGEQARERQDAGAATQRAALADTERALVAALGHSGTALRAEVTDAIDRLRASNEARLAEIARTLAEQLRALGEQNAGAAAALRGGIDQQLTVLREGNEKKLGEIQATVNEQLAKTVEAQMTASFARVTEQFAQVQKAMGEMQAVGAQIGDIKRLFGNVKTRGGWGETQVRAMLEDVLPQGAYDTNWKPRADSDDVVEFAILMPMRGEHRPRLPVDAKFPVEDYERLLSALDAADPEAERAARRALAQRVRGEARKIADKYIVPPATVEFAVMYLPTDGLYAEVARMDGLVDELGRVHRVLVMGPSLFPALLRTIHLGYMTLTLEQKADEVHRLLGAARGEMQQMDKVLSTLGKQASAFSNTIERARVRTRAVNRKLQTVEALDPEAAALLIGPVDETPDEAEEG